MKSLRLAENEVDVSRADVNHLGARVSGPRMWCVAETHQLVHPVHLIPKPPQAGRRIDPISPDAVTRMIGESTEGRLAHLGGEAVGLYTRRTAWEAICPSRSSLHSFLTSIPYRIG